MSAGAGLALGELVWILGLASVIMVMGLVDDLKNLDWRLRLGIQVGCAVDPGRDRESASRCSGRSPIRSWAAR